MSIRLLYTASPSVSHALRMNRHMTYYTRAIVTLNKLLNAVLNSLLNRPALLNAMLNTLLNTLLHC